MKPSSFSYKEYKPSPKLKHLVERVWVFESRDEPEDIKNFRLIPDYTASLILILPLGSGNLRSFITGPNTYSFPIDNFTDQITFGFRFFSYNMPSLFGRLPNETLNSKVTPQILNSPKAVRWLTAELRKSAEVRQMLSIISEFLSVNLEKVTIYKDDITAIISRIISSDGAVKLEDIYSTLSISQRQFQRKFSKRTGITPKEFCKIVRFHHVTRKLVKNNFRHFDTLVESGYYDQSHYYREFKEFIGMLPTRFELRQKKFLHTKLLK